MTITLTLPRNLIERAQALARARGVSVEVLLSQAIAWYIEEQDDIAYAKKTLSQVRSGAMTPVVREEMEARLFGGEG